jgi:flavin-binding protein dodecin
MPGSGVARVIEISARSDQSFEDAIRQGVSRAAQTLRNVQGAWVKEQEVGVENGQITSYQVVLKVTFLMEDPQSGGGDMG